MLPRLVLEVKDVSKLELSIKIVHCEACVMERNDELVEESVLSFKKEQLLISFKNEGDIFYLRKSDSFCFSTNGINNQYYIRFNLSAVTETSYQMFIHEEQKETFKKLLKIMLVKINGRSSRFSKDELEDWEKSWD